MAAVRESISCVCCWLVGAHIASPAGLHPLFLLKRDSSKVENSGLLWDMGHCVWRQFYCPTLFLIWVANLQSSAEDMTWLLTALTLVELTVAMREEDTSSGSPGWRFRVVCKPSIFKCWLQLSYSGWIIMNTAQYHVLHCGGGHMLKTIPGILNRAGWWSNLSGMVIGTCTSMQVHTLVHLVCVRAHLYICAWVCTRAYVDWILVYTLKEAFRVRKSASS